MSNVLSYIRHDAKIRKGRAIIDDKRWMIRGVGRDLRQAVKDAAKTEGVSVGAWVRRSIVSALDAAADGPTTLAELTESVRVLGARLSVLEKSHHTLHQKVHAASKSTRLFTPKKRMT